MIGWHAEHPILEEQTHWRTKWKLFRIQYRQNPAAPQHIPMNQPLQSSKCSGTKGSASSTHLDIFFIPLQLIMIAVSTHIHINILNQTQYSNGQSILKSIYNISESFWFNRRKNISSVLCLQNTSQSAFMNITFPCGGLTSLSKI